MLILSPLFWLIEAFHAIILKKNNQDKQQTEVTNVMKRKKETNQFMMARWNEIELLI